MTNILVVDDEVGVCCVIQHLLVREGYAVTALTDGRQALDVVARSDFAAALIDLNLADIDGNDVIRAARAARPNMPIVMMSGMVLESRSPWDYRRGFRDFIDWPNPSSRRTSRN